MNYLFPKKELKDFISKAAKSTYAGGGKPVENPQRPGFIELVYLEGDYSYRDSYSGFYRSRGMEVVRYKNEVVWSSSYGGGMTDGNEELASKTFEFLKKAMSANKEGFDTFRGPHEFKKDDWKYIYKQEGDVLEFSGHEEIYYKNKFVFFHKIIGGIIKK